MIEIDDDEIIEQVYRNPTWDRLLTQGREIVNPLKLFGNNLWFWGDAQREGFANNDAVGTWTDWGNRRNHFTQGTGSAKPTFKKSGLNGLPSLSFDGGDFLNGPSGILDVFRNVGGGAVFSVVQWPTPSAANQTVLSVSNGTLNTTNRASQAQTLTTGTLRTGARRLDADSAGTAIDGTPTTGAAAVLVSTWEWTNNTVGSGFNGGVVTTTTISTSGVTSNTASLAVVIGSAGDGLSAWWTSHVGAVLIVRGLPSLRDQALAARYLARRWSINRVG